MCAKSAAVRPRAKPMDTSVGIQALLVIDAFVRLTIWAASLAVTLLVLSRTQFVRTLSWESLQSLRGAWECAITINYFVLLFNAAYVVALVILRFTIPLPERGMYKLAGTPDKNLLFSAFAGILTKARHYAPFP